MSTPAAIRQWESHFRLYRTIWKSNVMASVVQPFLYLLGMGVGVGALVDKGAHANASLGRFGSGHGCPFSAAVLCIYKQSTKPSTSPGPPS